MMRKIIVILLRVFLLWLFGMIGLLVMRPFLPFDFIIAIQVVFVYLISIKSNIWKVNKR